MFRELKKGLYSHFKKGALYVVYDKTNAESNMAEEVSYVRLSDGEKFNRDAEGWFDDVSKRPDNETGQKTRYKLMDTEVTFYINSEFETEPTLKEFLKANGIPFGIELGDKILVPTANAVEGEELQLNTWVITGITDQGLYVGLDNGNHSFVNWKYITAFVKNFK